MTRSGNIMHPELDKLFGPKREETKLENGNWKITVTPPNWSGFSGNSIELNPDQYHRYKQWRDQKGMIQDLFPELSAAQREILQSGIGPDEWGRLRGEEDT